MDVNSGRKVDHLIEIFRHLNRDDVGLVIVGSGLCETLKAQMNKANTVSGRGGRSPEPSDRPHL
jgi:hypothetical protein